MKYKFLLLFVCYTMSLCFCNKLFCTTTQENIWIEGKVVNKNEVPVAGVYIYSKFSKADNTITDSEGNFKLMLKKGLHILVFSHTTYLLFQEEVSITGAEALPVYLTVYLEERHIFIDEVIISTVPRSTAAPLENIIRHHQTIAGGTSVAVINPDVQRLETLKDALKFEPGVIIQESFGANDQPRISIRGSGIQSNPQRRGLQFLQDQIPVNFADGSFITGVMDPSVAESVEVFKGANALEFGTATLGGALNFNSRTGRYSPGLRVKTESGSYGYYSFMALMGEKRGDTDAYLSVSASRQDGFRAHNQNKKLGVAANLGHRISNNIDNRTYFNYSYIDFDIPGPLPLSVLLEDPGRINQGVNLPYTMGPDIMRDKPKREARVMRIANRTAFSINPAAEASLSVYYQHIEDRFVFPIVLSTQRSSGHDFGLAFRTAYNINHHKISAGLIGSYGSIDRRGHINVNGQDSYRFSQNRLHASNLTLYTEGYFRLGKRLHLTANLQAAYNERNSKDLFPDPELRPWYSHSSHQYRYFYSENTSLDQSYRAFNSGIGAVYNAGKKEKEKIQLFANISTSYEPPTFDELVGTAVTENINTSPKKLYAVRLDKQSALTAEIGSRYQGDRYGWNVSLYHSWLKNELLEVKDFVLGVKETKNYPNTIHRGIEAGFMVVPAEGIFSPAKKDRIELRGMYTYSDFYFSSGTYQDNSIAGIPPHYLSGAITYRYPGGVFLSFNMESQPEESYVDHQNTLRQPSFTIYGFRIGFEKWKNFSFYIEGKNIFNTYYASSYIISDQIHLPAIPFPQFTVNNIAFFMPGQTRAFYAGLSYEL